jgi:hypothetical protein
VSPASSVLPSEKLVLWFIYYMKVKPTIRSTFSEFVPSMLGPRGITLSGPRITILLASCVPHLFIFIFDHTLRPPDHEIARLLYYTYIHVCVCVRMHVCERVCGVCACVFFIVVSLNTLATH